MKATITIKGETGFLWCQTVLEDGQPEHLFKSFRETVNDFRAANLDPSWQLCIDVEDDAPEVETTRTT